MDGRKIDNITVPTEIAEIGYMGMMKVECGTNGYGGGDTGHGGRAYVRIGNNGDCDIRGKVSGYYEDAVEITVGGDCEIDNLADALLWASRVLKAKCGKPLDKYVYAEMEDVGGQKAYNKYEKFYNYLCDLLPHYHWEKSLRNMSDYAKKYHCRGVTKEQFFQNGLHNKLSITEKEATELYDKIFKSEKK